MLTFQYPMMLWGLLGLAVPVLLHLIQRELFRPLRFPSIRFILKGNLPFQRRRIPRDLLLLAFRLLLFSALIFALARPEWQPRAEASGVEEGSDERIVFLVDLSASMGGWNSWEEARENIEIILEERPGAEAGLVFSSDRVVEAIAPTRDHAALHSALDRAEPETVAANHREGLRESVSLLGDAGAGRGLFIVSDLQATAWETGRLPEVPHGIDIEWLRVGSERTGNSAVLRVRSYPRSEDGRHVQAELRNFGSEPEERAVTLRVGTETHRQEVLLAPERVVEVSFDISAPDTSRGNLSLDGDRFDADDHYYFWTGRPPAIPVLAVVPLADEPEKAEELFFLQRALEAREDTLWIQFEVDTVEPVRPGEDWTAYQAVFLLGAPAYFDDEGWNALERYLESGGVVIATPGEAPGRLIGMLRERGLLDAEYHGAARADRRAPTTLSLDWINPDSPLGGVFTDEAAGSLRMVSFYRYLRVTARDEDAETWLGSSQDDPLLIHRGIGGGSFVFLTFSFATNWSDLPLTGGFLPLVRELIAGDLQADHGIVREETGFPVTRVAEAIGVAPGAASWGEVDPRAPGVHSVDGIPIEINLSRRESSLETASPVDLVRAMRPRADREVPVAAAWGDIEESGAARPLWHWFALAAAIFFVTEMLIAARGDGSRARLTTGTHTATYREADT